mmetsp:Transcript_2378/g.3612  ORF Transcript_2378/g.3612 Transcript_2378/m.3612 type:complete len:375 (+) Transcript_2378:1082-2206(+)
MPHGIETERIDRFSFPKLSCHLSNFTLLRCIAGENPAGAEEVKTKREAIVVDKTSIYGEESHHYHHITTSVQASGHFIQLGLFVLLFVPKKVETSTEEEHTVTDVSVHNTEQEGECCGSEESGVGLSIPGNTIGVNKLLVTVSELVCGKMSGRSGPGLRNLIHVVGHAVVHVNVGAVHAHADVLKVFRDNPSLATKHSTNVGLEHVEGVVNSLLTENNPRPTFGVLGEHLAETEASVLILEKDGARINKFLGVLSQHTVDSGGIVHIGERVTVSEESITDLLELGLNGEGLEEDNEDTLLNQGSSLRVGNGLLDRGKPHVAVTTCGTENHTLKAHLLLGGHHTSDTGETHVHITGLIIMGPSQETLSRAWATGG